MKVEYLALNSDGTFRPVPKEQAIIVKITAPSGKVTFAKRIPYGYQN